MVKKQLGEFELEYRQFTKSKFLTVGCRLVDTDMIVSSKGRGRRYRYVINIFRQLERDRK